MVLIVSSGDGQTVVLAWMEFSVFLGGSKCTRPTQVQPGVYSLAQIVQNLSIIFPPRRVPRRRRFCISHCHRSYCGSEGTVRNLMIYTFLLNIPYWLSGIDPKIQGSNPDLSKFLCFFLPCNIGWITLTGCHGNANYSFAQKCVAWPPSPSPFFLSPLQILSGGRLYGRWSRRWRRRSIPGPTFLLLDGVCVCVCFVEPQAGIRRAAISPGRILEQDIPGNTLALTMGKISGFFFHNFWMYKCARTVILRCVVRARGCLLALLGLGGKRYWPNKVPLSGSLDWFIW